MFLQKLNTFLLQTTVPSSVLLVKLLFVNWLYNHSSVLRERAEIIRCAEMLMQEDDFGIYEDILRQQELLRERIDDRLSEEITQKCRTLNGEKVWPWILPFSIGLKHTDIQYQQMFC